MELLNPKQIACVNEQMGLVGPHEIYLLSTEVDYVGDYPYQLEELEREEGWLRAHEAAEVVESTVAHIKLPNHIMLVGVQPWGTGDVIYGIVDFSSVEDT